MLVLLSSRAKLGQDLCDCQKVWVNTFVKKLPYHLPCQTYLWKPYFSYDSLTIELNYLLNWISRIFLNWIIFWIESWVKRYWIEYWMNHFLAKFKHWIESDRVSNTPTMWRTLEGIRSTHLFAFLSIFDPVTCWLKARATARKGFCRSLAFPNHVS